MFKLRLNFSSELIYYLPIFVVLRECKLLNTRLLLFQKGRGPVLVLHRSVPVREARLQCPDDVIISQWHLGSGQLRKASLTAKCADVSNCFPLPRITAVYIYQDIIHKSSRLLGIAYPTWWPSPLVSCRRRTFLLAWVWKAPSMKGRVTFSRLYFSIWAYECSWATGNSALEIQLHN